MFEAIITFITIFILLPGLWYAVQYGMLEFAKMGIFWDIVPEGFARAYTRMGKVAKVVMSYSGHEFSQELENPDDDDTDNLGVYKIVPAPNSQALQGMSTRVLDILAPARGVVWKGLPGFYETYTIPKLTWIDDSFESRVSENVTEILVRSYSYGLKMDNVELEGNLEFNFKFLVVLQVVNPAKALFRIQRYVDAVLKGINLLVIQEFKNLSWTDIVGTKGTTATSNNALREALDRVLDDAFKFEEEWGVAVRDIGVYDFEAANESAKAAITSEEVAELKAKAALAEAEGKAKVIKTVAQAEAEATFMKMKAEADGLTALNEAAEKMGPNGLRIKELDTIREAGANVTLIGSGLQIPAVIPIQPNKP